jgi:hypothetical protein
VIVTRESMANVAVKARKVGHQPHVQPNILKIEWRRKKRYRRTTDGRVVINCKK